MLIDQGLVRSATKYDFLRTTLRRPTVARSTMAPEVPWNRPGAETSYRQRLQAEISPSFGLHTTFVHEARGMARSAALQPLGGLVFTLAFLFGCAAATNLQTDGEHS